MQRRLAREVGVASNHVSNRRAGDQIIIDRPVDRADAQRVRDAVPEVEGAPISVVEEQPVAPARPTGRDEEGDRLVDGVGRRREAVSVAIPVDERVAAAVEHAGLVAHAEIMFGQRHRLAQLELSARRADRARVGADDLAAEIERFQFHAGRVDPKLHRRGPEPGRSGGHPDAVVTNLRRNGPARILPELACARDAHADDGIGERGHALRTGGAAYLDAVPQVSQVSACRVCVSGTEPERKGAGGSQQTCDGRRQCQFRSPVRSIRSWAPAAGHDAHGREHRLEPGSTSLKRDAVTVRQ